MHILSSATMNDSKEVNKLICQTMYSRNVAQTSSAGSW